MPDFSTPAIGALTGIGADVSTVFFAFIAIWALVVGGSVVVFALSQGYFHKPGEERFYDDEGWKEGTEDAWIDERQKAEDERFDKEWGSKF